MMRAGRLQRHLVWRAQYGSRAPKTTHFAAVNVPKFAAILRKHRQEVDWKSLEQLGGRAPDGQRRTAQAKEYPPQLNQVIAETHFETYLERTSKSARTEPLPTSSVRAFDALYAGDVDQEQQQIAPDHHRLSRPLDDFD